MAWWGKLIGGAFGFMLSGPIGALLGAALGHRFDEGLRSAAVRAGGAQERIQAAFFTATFAVMGRIAKADGQVTHDEIALANQVMQKMQLNEQQRTLARKLFNEGKRAGFDVDAVLAQLHDECGARRNLIRVFIEIQIHAALADGRIAPEENQLLQRAANALGVAADELERLINMMRGAGNSQQRGAKMHIADARRILGVAPNASLADARKAYRRLISQHHPDKLVAKGLPEEMIKLANQKTAEIRDAWECIKDSRDHR